MNNLLLHASSFVLIALLLSSCYNSEPQETSNPLNTKTPKVAEIEAATATDSSLESGNPDTVAHKDSLKVISHGTQDQEKLDSIKQVKLEEKKAYNGPNTGNDQ